jgi:hypothetical protein
MAPPVLILPLPVLLMASTTMLHAFSCDSDSTTGSMLPLAITMFELLASLLLIAILTSPGGSDSTPVLMLFAAALCFCFFVLPCFYGSGKAWREVRFFFGGVGASVEFRQIFDVLNFTYVGLHTSSDTKDIFWNCIYKRRSSYIN